MKSQYFVFVGFVMAVASSAATASQALATRYACVACHQADRKLVGPSWNDIASKYAGSSTTVAELAESIRRGSTGKWGSMPMPAQPALSAEDARSLAQWILEHRAGQ